MIIEPSALDEELAAHPLFGLLDEAARRALTSTAAHYFLDPGELLYAAGRPADRAFVVLAGGLQIEFPPDTTEGESDGDPRGIVQTIVLAPGFLGECQLLHRRPWTGTGVAIAPTRALGVRREVLEALMAAGGPFALAVYREVTLRFLDALTAARRRPVRTPEQAVARFVVASYDAQLRLGRTAVIAQSQSEIAGAAGMRRETVNRILRRWSKAGWVVVRGTQLEVVDVPALRAILLAEDSLVRAPGDGALRLDGAPEA
jgi:CRP-like cAMP-binding protein